MYTHTTEVKPQMLLKNTKCQLHMCLSAIVSRPGWMCFKAFEADTSCLAVLMKWKY